MWLKARHVIIVIDLRVWKISMKICMISPIVSIRVIIVIITMRATITPTTACTSSSTKHSFTWNFISLLVTTMHLYFA